MGTDDALIDEVRASLETLAALAAHREHLGEDVVTTIESTLSDAERRLARDRLAVVLWGERGSGRTTFVNALLGARVLPSRRRETDTVMLVQRGSHENYRARLADGTLEEFDELCPAQSDSRAERLRVVEEALSRAKQERERAMQDLKAATQNVDQARSALANAFMAFEKARDEADRLGRELARFEADEIRLERLAAERARALPARVIETPAPWALWLWFARIFLLLWNFKEFRAHQEALRELHAARARAASLRRDTSEAASHCLALEGEIASAASPAESTDTAMIHASSRLSELDGRIAELEPDVTRCRTELEEARAARHRQYCQAIAALCDPEMNEGVEEIEITYPARFLPADVTVILVPDPTTASPRAQEVAMHVVRERADGCILVSELERGVSGSTHQHLRLLRDIVPHMVLLLTKMDESFAQALDDRAREPWKRIEQARRIGTRRFAREVGRDPDAVLSIAVAAEPTLMATALSDAVKRFAADTHTLFQLLRSERALILGTRAAAEVRRCIRSIGDAEEWAERSYEQKILQLERQQRPEPALFRREQLEAAEPMIKEAARALTEAAVDSVETGIHALRRSTERLVEACSTPAELEDLFSGIDSSLAQATHRLRLETAQLAEERMDAALRDLEQPAFDALRERYRITAPAARWSYPSIHLEETRLFAEEPFALAPIAEANIRSFTFARAGLLLGGLTAGALVGTVAVPVVGTVIGAAAGVALPFVKTFASLKRDCLRAVDARLDQAQRVLVEDFAGMRETFRRTIRAALDRSLSRAAVQYDEWITAPLEAERAVLERERQMLGQLVALRECLEEHDESIAHAIKAATEASRGLCKAS